MKKRIFYIDVNDEAAGMNAISLVKYPAVQYDFLQFNEDKQPVQLYFNDEKRVITGIVALADTPIYRYEQGFGEYWVIFTKDVIEKMVVKYSKDGLFNSVNLQHNDEKFVDGVYLFESYIINRERGILPTEFDNVTEGSWVCSFKVENEDVWNEIKNGKDLNGFSLQGLFELIEGKLTDEIDDLINEILD
jgi:hypothetical protein